MTRQEMAQRLEENRKSKLAEALDVAERAVATKQWTNDTALAFVKLAKQGLVSDELMAAMQRGLA